MNITTSCVLLLMIALLTPVTAQTTRWARGGTGGTISHSHRVAVDSKGNVYAAGSFMGYIGFGYLMGIPQGIRSIFLVKYDSAGTVQWVRSAGGAWVSFPGDAGINDATGLCIDSTGNIYITGFIFGPNYKFDSVQFRGGSGNQAFLAKYNPSGDFLWVRRDSVAPYSTGSGVVCGPDGNIYMTGRYGKYQGTVFTAKYTPEGVEVWRDIPSILRGSAKGTDIAVNSRGDLFVMGSMTGAFLFDSVEITTNGDGSQDFIVKYDLQGRAIWARSGWHGKFGVGVAIGADSAGSCYIAANNAMDGYLAKYDSTGNQLWRRDIHAKVNGIALQPSGEFYCTGSFKPNPGTIDTITIPSPISSSIGTYLASFNTDGYIVWAKAIRGNKLNEGCGVTYDSHGDIYITGDFGDSWVMYDTLRVDTVTLVGISDRNVFTARLGPRDAASDVWPDSRVSGVRLHQNLPNPFSGSTAIEFELPERMPASLTLYDTKGEQVTILFSGTADAGIHTARLDASGLPIGQYHLRLAAGGTTVTRQIVVIR